MKTCPNCNQPVARRKGGCCPECGVALFIDSKKQLRLEDDKIVIDDFLTLTELHIKQRDRIAVGLKNDAAERSYAYALLDKTRVFINANEDVGLNPHEMFLQCFNHVMTYNPWWSNNLKSTRMLLRQWEKLLAKFYQIKRTEYQKSLAQEKRMSRTTQTILEISYDVI